MADFQDNPFANPANLNPFEVSIDEPIWRASLLDTALVHLNSRATVHSYCTGRSGKGSNSKKTDFGRLQSF